MHRIEHIHDDDLWVSPWLSILTLGLSANRHGTKMQGFHKQACAFVWVAIQAIKRHDIHIVDLKQLHVHPTRWNRGMVAIAKSWPRALREYLPCYWLETWSTLEFLPPFVSPLPSYRALNIRRMREKYNRRFNLLTLYHAYLAFQPHWWWLVNRVPR